MGRIPKEDSTQHDEFSIQSVGEKAMLEALESVCKAVEDGRMTTRDYYFKFTTTRFNKQAGSCKRQSRRSPLYEQELSAEMLTTVETAFEAVENGSLKEEGYYFELTTPYSRYTSGCYSEEEKYVNTYLDVTLEFVLYATAGYYLRLDAVLKCVIVVTSLIRKFKEVEWLRPPGSEMIQIILVVSVLTGQTEASPVAGEEQPLTLTAGENGIIPFECRNEQQSALKYYTVKFEEKDHPFYINGVFYPEGFMSTDQAERFRMEYYEDGSTMSVKINIEYVSVGDQGTYIVLLIVQRETLEYHSIKRVVLIVIPPNPVRCSVMPSEMVDFYEVRCKSEPGSGNSTLTCFQNGDKIPYWQNTGDTQIVNRRIFWVMHINIPVSCCSHDIKEIATITQTSCDQYRYPRIEPANSPVPPVHEIHTKMAPNMEEKTNQPSPESALYSGCGQSFDRPTVKLPIMALFAYVCLSHT